MSIGDTLINGTSIVGYTNPYTGGTETSSTVGGGLTSYGNYIDQSYVPNTYAEVAPIGPGVLGEQITKTPAQIAAEQKLSEDNRIRGIRDTARASIYGSANDAATNLQGSFANSVQDNLHVLQQGQQAIDMKGQQNEAARTQGVNGILGMIGRGVQSGGRYLANRNAGSSSAAGEIARAYGDIGRRQMSSVGNQYEQNNQQILQDQSNQDYNVGKTKRDFSQSLNNSVNQIVESARTELANLDAQSANASLPDRIAIEQEKQNIKNQVLAKLQQYDAQLASGADQIKARDRQGNMAAATQQLAAGQAPEGSFQYTDQAPGQFQNTGPFSSGLPIFINPNRRQLA